MLGLKLNHISKRGHWSCLMSWINNWLSLDGSNIPTHFQRNHRLARSWGVLFYGAQNSHTLKDANVSAAGEWCLSMLSWLEILHPRSKLFVSSRNVYASLCLRCSSSLICLQWESGVEYNILLKALNKLMFYVYTISNQTCVQSKMPEYIILTSTIFCCVMRPFKLR